MSGTYTTACGDSRSLTQWGRPGIKPTSSLTLCWVLNPLSHNGNSYRMCVCVYVHTHTYTHTNNLGLVHQRDAMKIFSNFSPKKILLIKYGTFRVKKKIPNDGLYLSLVNSKPCWFMTIIKATEYASNYVSFYSKTVPSQCLASLLLLDLENTLICCIKEIMLLWNKFLFFPSDRSPLPSGAIASTKSKEANNQAKVQFSSQWRAL